VKQSTRLARRAYSIAEVSEMCGVEHKAVRRAILDGRLKAIRLNPDSPHSKYLIPAAALDDWLAGGEQ
jgi:excisionase family DNA binding protein